ncbi:hypothetical protein J7E62_22185 [Variovorax paradoxus]|nr:hypothetical protein [Variovorax paradoxus]
MKVTSTNFDLIECVIDPSTSVSYGVAIAKVLRLFLGRYDWAYTHFPPFFLPHRNEDGTITIDERGG